MFVQCKFSKDDPRGYTYANRAGLPLKVGDRVRLETRKSTGVAFVAALDVEAPEGVPADKIKSIVAIEPDTTEPAAA
ncbi:MAG: hypothetical protein ACREH4_01340 [Vitreimonas sp.]